MIQPQQGHTVPSLMIDARGDGLFDALQPPGDGVKHVSCACKPSEPSQSPARRAAQRHEGACSFVSDSASVSNTACVCLQRRAWPAAFQRGTRDAMQALPSLLPAGPTQRQSKARRGEERVSRPKKKKTTKKKKQKREQKARAGITPPAAPPFHPPQQQPKEAIEDNPRAVIGERDSTARRRLQRH